MGDGQKVSLRLQASTFFRTYSLSFSEPWFGGKKPVSFSASISQSKQYLYTGAYNSIDKSKSFNITSVSVGIAKRLTVPDDYFVLSNGLSFQHYDLSNYNTGLFTFGNGSSKNFAFNIGLTRNSKGVNPIFPTKGSEFSISTKFTLPYSSFNNIDYGNLKNLAEYKKTYESSSVTDQNFGADGVFINQGDYIKTATVVNPQGQTVTGIVRTDNYQEADVDQGKVDQKRFDWLEYYKIKAKFDWYSKLIGSDQSALVLRSLAEFGYLGAFNSERGIVPFERFFVGGDGLANFALDGREVVQLRGYPNQSLSSVSGGTIYNKFSLELRYPLTLKAAASIYGLTFIEGGAAFDNFQEYNPFVLQRSAGFGIRIFMPAFGLLGIDFAHGFDPIPGSSEKSGWQTHFIIGQQF
jgi:outer membrane protein insertion porin family